MLSGIYIENNNSFFLYIYAVTFKFSFQCYVSRYMRLESCSTGVSDAISNLNDSTHDRIHVVGILTLLTVIMLYDISF